MVCKREGHRLDGWLQRVVQSELPELQSFASGVEKDKDAVKAGLTWQINNGMVEGHVTKLKRDLANDVWQSWLCPAAPTGASCRVEEQEKLFPHFYSKRRRNSSTSSPRASENPLPSPILVNPHFSRTRSEPMLSLAARAYRGRPLLCSRKAESALVAMPLPQ